MFCICAERLAINGITDMMSAICSKYLGSRPNQNTEGVPFLQHLRLRHPPSSPTCGRGCKQNKQTGFLDSKEDTLPRGWEEKCLGRLARVRIRRNVGTIRCGKSHSCGVYPNGFSVCPSSSSSSGTCVSSLSLPSHSMKVMPSSAISARV